MKLTPGVVVKQTREHGWTWTSGGAICGFGFGMICPFIGSILTAISWYTGPHWHGFSIQRYGTVLLFLTIPLLIFGAHCLDLMDKEDEERAMLAQRDWQLRLEGGRKGNDLGRD